MLPDLDHTGPVPLYQQIQQWIREQIVGGAWPEHYKLKSETDLAVELDVNRGTLRNAISGLIDEGLLVRIHGKGTFVASRTVAQPLAENLITFTEGFLAQHIPFTTTVLHQATVIPDPAVCSLLSLTPQEPVFFLKRIRYVKAEPLILLENYVVYALCKGIEQTNFTSESLFDTLEHRFGLTIDWGQRYFHAQAATPEVATALNIEVGDPIMYIKQIVYQPDGSPIEMSNMWVRGSHFQVSAIVRRGSRRSQLNIVRDTAEAHQTISTPAQQTSGKDHTHS